METFWKSLKLKKTVSECRQHQCWIENCVSGRLSTPAVDHGRVVGAAVGQNRFVQSAAVAEVDRTGRSIAGVAAEVTRVAVLENLAAVGPDNQAVGYLEESLVAEGSAEVKKMDGKDQYSMFMRNGTENIYLTRSPGQRRLSR